MRSLADALGSLPPDEAKARLDGVRSFLVETLVPHEEHEDRRSSPCSLARRGSDDLTAALHRTHTEIFHLIRLPDRMVDELPEEGPAPEDLNDLRRVLYGLDAILRLHMAQEEELYMALGDDHPTGRRAGDRLRLNTGRPVRRRRRTRLDPSNVGEPIADLRQGALATLTPVISSWDRFHGTGSNEGGEQCRVGRFGTSPPRGVSKATASRVLNGSSQVDPATRERVLKAMAELEYTPSSARAG